MKGIEIRNADVLPLDDVATGLHGLRILMVNVYSIETDAGWALVDAGLPMSASRIRHWAERRFGRPPRVILLSHGHVDHVGALDELLKDWNVPVFAHPLELPYLRGKAKYPPPDIGVGGGIMPLLSPLFSRGPFDFDGWVLPFPDHGFVPFFEDWQWIHTPGHTEGHVSLFRASDRSLIVGDAFCTTKQESFLSIATQKPELHGPPAYYTTDWDKAKASVSQLATLKPNVIAAGHGSPMRGPEVASGLDTLAEQFDWIARPHRQGRAA
jgi:glyoxylase-like metal-dependent hydrolase (beta-lactamase superfamily II)